LLRQHDAAAEGVSHAGAAPALNALVRGQAQWMIPSLFSALPYLKTGKLRALAVAAPERLATWPEVPTFAELGLAALDLTQWYGLFAPARTPRAVVERLNQSLNRVLSSPETASRLLEDGVQVQTSSPEALTTHVQAELQRWRGVIDAFEIREVTESIL